MHKKHSLFLLISLFYIVVFSSINAFAFEKAEFDNNIQAIRVISVTRNTPEEIERSTQWATEHPGIDTIKEEDKRILYFKLNNELYVDIVRRNYVYVDIAGRDYGEETGGDIHLVYRYLLDKFVKVAEFKEQYRGKDTTAKFFSFPINDITIARTSVNNNSIQIYDNVSLNFDSFAEAGASARLTLVEGDKKEELPYTFEPNNASYYINNEDLDYMYIDRLNGLIFYIGYTIGGAGNGGIVKYDINNNISELILKAWYRDDKKIYYEFFAPMRLPNTQYLIFGANVYRHAIEVESSTEVGKVYETEPAVSLRIVYLKEIDEWKKEIELQNKNERLHKTAKKYFIDGPAKVRDNPNGKVIAVLNDMTKIIVLSQKGDWYEILYAHVKGWTYKDNLVK
jgi:hypothetical protein